MSTLSSPAVSKAWAEVSKPVVVDATTICGSDLHILKDDVPAVTVGRILGHLIDGTPRAADTAALLTPIPTRGPTNAGAPDG